MVVWGRQVAAESQETCGSMCRKHRENMNHFLENIWEKNGKMMMMMMNNCLFGGFEYVSFQQRSTKKCGDDPH
jgi:hypothetical protein